VAKFRYLGTTVTYQKLIHEEIKSTLNSGNACCHSFFNLLSRLLSKNVRIKIYRTVSLFGCETWSLTLKEEHRLWMFGNRVLRRIFGPKMHELLGGWINLHNEELHNLHSSQNISRMIKSRRMWWTGQVALM
jgi:hypothetical protein